MKMSRNLPVLVVALLFGLCWEEVSAKEKKTQQDQESKEKETSSAFSLKVPVNVVVVSAMATDKQGNAVKDLKAEDFKVYEDGKPQPIHTFARESYQAVQALPGEKMAGAAVPGPEAVGDRPHFIALMIDDLNAPAYDSMYRTVEAVKQYVTADVHAGDQVGITSTSGRIQVPFTSDVEILRDQLTTLLKTLEKRPIMQVGCTDLTELQALQIEKYLVPGSMPRPRGESPADIAAYLNAGGCRLTFFPPEVQVAVVETFLCEHLESLQLGVQAAANHVYSTASSLLSESTFRHRLMLNAVRQYVRSMRHFEGRKSLILFSEGFLSEPVRYELQDVVDTALRSGVYVNAVDIRGLYTVGPDASMGVSLPAGTYIENKLTFTGVTERVPVSQILSYKTLTLLNSQSDQDDPLAQLASETGGIFFHNSNDLNAGIKKAIDHQSFYYVLTYASPDTRNDGRYHKIKLEVSRPGLKLRYREGYYAPREQISTERRKKEDIMEALQAPGDLNEIPVQLSYQFSQISDSTYELSLLTRVNVSRLEFLSEDIHHKNSLSLVVAAFDEHNKWVDGLEKIIEFNLSEPSYAALVQYGFSSKVDFNLPPGRYRIRTIVREGLKSQMGSASRLIEVP